MTEGVLTPLASALAEIEERRGCGTTHVGTSAETDPAAAARLFGLTACPDDDISRDDARSLLAWILGNDLAYRAAIDLHGADAERLASAVFDAIPADARILTNGLNPPASKWGWEPCTDATFDTGLLVVHSGGSLCVWVEDED